MVGIRGVVFGRKPKLTSHQRREALERRADGEFNDFAEVKRLGDVPRDFLRRAYDFVGQMRARKLR